MKDTIDLKKIAWLLWDKILWILSCAILCGAIAYAYSAFLVTPQYTANMKLYATIQPAEDDSTVSTAEITIRQRIIPLYVEALTSYDNMELLSARMQEKGYQVSAAVLRGAVSVKADSNTTTDILYVSAKTFEAKFSQDICNTLAELAPEFVDGLYAGCSINVLDSARMPRSASSPNIFRNTVVGILLGIVLSCAVIILLHMMDNSVKDADQVTEVTQLRLLGQIPDMRESMYVSESYGKHTAKYGK